MWYYLFIKITNIDIGIGTATGITQDMLVDVDILLVSPTELILLTFVLRGAITGVCDVVFLSIKNYKYRCWHRNNYRDSTGYVGVCRHFTE